MMKIHPKKFKTIIPYDELNLCFVDGLWKLGTDSITGKDDYYGYCYYSNNVYLCRSLKNYRVDSIKDVYYALYSLRLLDYIRIFILTYLSKYKKLSPINCDRPSYKREYISYGEVEIRNKSIKYFYFLYKEKNSYYSVHHKNYCLTSLVHYTISEGMQMDVISHNYIGLSYYPRTTEEYVYTEDILPYISFTKGKLDFITETLEEFDNLYLMFIGEHQREQNLNIILEYI